MLWDKMSHLIGEGNKDGGLVSVIVKIRREMNGKGKVFIEGKLHGIRKK